MKNFYKSKMIQLYITIVLLCVSVYAQEEYYYRIGQPCNLTKETDTKLSVGSCKLIHECPVAVRLVNSNKLKPDICYFEDKVAVVCCPFGNKIFQTGQFRHLFEHQNNNFIRGHSISCFYDGNEPMSCCGKPKMIDKNEPKGCPSLPQPVRVVTGSTKYDKVMRMCHNYQRYFYKCVTDESGKGFVRRKVWNATQSVIRTYGGEAAQLMEFPHMAVLGIPNNNVNEEEIIWVSGGSLISDQYILTAAHALALDKTLVRYALLGTTNKTQIREGLLFIITRHLVHPDYDSTKQIHDIALVQLDRKVPFSEFIRPICLPLPGMNLKAVKYLAAGWGETENHTSSEILLKVYLAAIPADKCQGFYNQNRRYNNESMICAEGLVVKRKAYVTDTCQGDSGGPLMITNNEVNHSYVAVGVVSYGSKCGSKQASYYTRVAYYLDWIIENVWPN